jgi:stage V sporulation protein K
MNATCVLCEYVFASSLLRPAATGEGLVGVVRTHRGHPGKSVQTTSRVMLPGEELWFERLWQSLPLPRVQLNSSSWWVPPAGDGSVWWVNPQVISAVLLSVITCILFASSRVRTAPRKIVRRLRRVRASVDRGRGRISKALTRTRVRHRLRAIDFASARAFLDQSLESMVGLANIKAHLSTLLDTLEMERRRSVTRTGDACALGQRGCLHMVFLGSPGTGKTAVAELVATVLREMGVLRRGQLVIAKKADLLGRYSNHVARNTRTVVESALGGVLLIDEAYALLQGEAELGREALNVLVDLCYEYKDDLVVILAGYAGPMADLLDENPGLASRFPHKFMFDDYSTDQLHEIARRMVASQHFLLAGEGADDALRRLVEPVASEQPSGNARSVENRIAAAISAQSSRLIVERRQQQQQQQQQCQHQEEAEAEYDAAGDAKGRLQLQTESRRSRASSTQSEGDDPDGESQSLFELTAADLDAACALADRAAATMSSCRAKALQGAAERNAKA